jgi:hypothetical protein
MKLLPAAITPKKIRKVVMHELFDLDGGRCLITNQKKPSASMQAAHIIGRRTEALKVFIMTTHNMGFMEAY